MRRKGAVAVLAGLAVAGCAGTGWDKLFPDPTTEVAVTSEPAGAQVRASSGQSCPATPCVVTLPVTQNPITLTVSRQGFLDQTVEVRAASMGERGDGIEPQRALSPNPVSLVLDPAPPPPPQKRRPPRQQQRPTAAR